MAQFHLSESDFESDSMESLSQHSVTTSYLTNMTNANTGTHGGMMCIPNSNGNGMEMH